MAPDTFEQLKDSLAGPSLAPRFLEAILSSTSEHVYLFDREGRCLYATRAASVALGYEPGELVGKTWRDLGMAPVAMERFDRLRTKVVSTGRPVTSEVRYPRAEGDRLFEVELTPVSGADRRVLAVAVTKRLLADRGRKRDDALGGHEDAVNERLAALEQITEVVLSRLPVEQLMDELLQRVREVFCSESATLLLLSEDRSELLVRASKGLEAAVRAHARVPVGKGLAGEIAAHGKPLLVDDLRDLEDVDPLLRESIRSFLGVPLTGETGPLGVLHVGRTRPGAFDELDLRLLEALADRIAAAVERVRLLDAERTARLRAERDRDHLDTVLHTVDALILVLDPAGRIVRFNHACERLSGYSFAEVEGRDFLDLLVPPEAQPAVQDVIARLLRRSGGSTHENEWRLRDGTRRLLSWKNDILTRPDGEVEFVLATGVDITDARRSRELLLASERRYRELLELLPMPTYTCDTGGRITFYNRSAVALWGREPDLEDDRWSGAHRFYKPDGAPLPFESIPMARALREGFVEPGQETVMERPDGSRAHVVSHLRQLRDADGSVLGAVNVLVDITERKAAEDALRESQQRVERTQAQSLVMTIHVGLDGRWLKVPPTFCRFLGYGPQDLPGPGFRDVTCPEDYWADWNQCLRLLRGELQSFEMEKRFLRKDGSVAWGYINTSVVRDEHGTPLHFLTYVRDIDAQKRAEEALRESEGRLRAVFEQAAVGIGRVGLDGRFLEVNDRYAEIVGRSAEELTALTFRQITYAEDLDKSTLLVEQLLSGERATYSLEKRYVRSDGSLAWVNLSVGLSRDAAGRPGNFIAVVEDIGDRKRAAQALHEADRRKDEFLGVLSHELRNPLAPIRNSLYVLERSATLDARGQRAAAVIGRQVGQLSRLIDDLLDVTRISRGKIRLQKSPVDLAEIMRRTAEDMRSVFAAGGLDFRTELPRHPVWVDGDPTRLAQIAGNLLQNAAKFTSAGGHVTLVVWLDSERGAVLEVADSGAGIEGEMLGRLFQPFSQADRTLVRSRGGLGLGLSLVKGLTELHGGKVEAFSEGSGRGARFRVTLPLTDGPATLAPKQAPAVEGRPSSRRILVVEDNRDAAETLRQALEINGHRVVVASSGPEGIAKAREFHPEVAVCDLGLPGFDGYELARRFRADEGLRRVPLIAVSGYAQPEDKRRAAEAGFWQHLSKPADLEALHDLLACPAAVPE